MKNFIVLLGAGLLLGGCLDRSDGGGDCGRSPSCVDGGLEQNDGGSGLRDDGVGGDGGSVFLPPPIISSIEPAQGPPGSLVELVGENFVVEPERMLIEFGINFVRPVSGSESRVVVEVPQQEPGQVIVRIDVDDKSSNQAFFTVESPRAAPSIAGLSPEAGFGGTTVVTVYGVSFSTQTTVIFDGEEQPTVFVDVNTIQFQVPLVPAGIYDLWVSESGLQSGKMSFTVRG